jgi:hypothetical protein
MKHRHFVEAQSTLQDRRRASLRKAQQKWTFLIERPLDWAENGLRSSSRTMGGGGGDLTRQKRGLISTRRNWSRKVETVVLTLYSVVLAPCSARFLTFTNSTFCPHGVFMCFVWIWEQTAIISLYSINWVVFTTETECVYCAVRIISF